MLSTPSRHYLSYWKANDRVLPLAPAARGARKALITIRRHEQSITVQRAAASVLVAAQLKHARGLVPRAHHALHAIHGAVCAQEGEFAAHSAAAVRVQREGEAEKVKAARGIRGLLAQRAAPGCATLVKNN